MPVVHARSWPRILPACEKPKTYYSAGIKYQLQHQKEPLIKKQGKLFPRNKNDTISHPSVVLLSSGDEKQGVANRLKTRKVMAPQEPLENACSLLALFKCCPPI